MRLEQDPRIITRTVEEPETQAPALPLSLNRALKYALAAIQGGPTAELYEALRTISDKYPRAYAKVLRAVAAQDDIAERVTFALHQHWVVVGFRTRAIIKDDGLIIRAFRRIFRPHAGEDLTIYRGERASEIEAGRLGLNWSTQREAARIFASGLCTTYGCDGVLLKATAPAAAVICLPNDHSIHLGEWEHIVDPALLIDVEEIDRFPPSD